MHRILRPLLDQALLLTIAAVMAFGNGLAVENVFALEACAAARLGAKHEELMGRLQHNEFHREMVVLSSDTAQRLAGEVYAVVDVPFSVVAFELRSSQTWCDVLTLHCNVKLCRAAVIPPTTMLSWRSAGKSNSRWPLPIVSTSITS